MNILKNINLIIAVTAGGGIGALLRFLISSAFKQNQNNFPFATFLINIVGCLLIGIFYSVIKPENTTLKAFLIIGLLGGFTTFSAFAFETIQLINSGKIFTAFFYVILSNIICFMSVYAGARFTSIF
ncbi:MAG: fluoride efflux transporter CrcB [Bacteroidia bacterium]|nr:fluoride efflux transporter CrcB [Bacteroidia bacterium]